MNKSQILVSLDGSDLSEAALAYATLIARANGAGLLLITVWEEGERALIANVPDVADSLFAQGEEYWESYLAGLAEELKDQEFDVETEVLIGDATEEILRIIRKRQPRLLVTATHGRSGLGRWHYGSVAGKLAREAPVPMLTIGPKVLADEHRDRGVRRILVPLDGSSMGEAALQPALELADACDADIVLARVLRWTTQVFIYGIPDVAVAQVDEDLEKAANDYLTRIRDSLATKRRVETEVLRGAPADALIDLIEAERIDLVVMASHTRGGIGRAMLGSVADRLLQGAAPVLLIRPEEVAPSKI